MADPKGFQQVDLGSAEVAPKLPNGMGQRLVIRLCPLARAWQWRLWARVAKAPAPLIALNKRSRDQRRCTDLSAMGKVVGGLRASNRVQGLLDVRYSGIRNSSGSARCGATPAGTPACGWRPGRQLTASVDQKVMATAVRRLSWRVYVIIQPPDQLSLQVSGLAR